MGMDVYGVKPKTSKGEYFRNNVWWWHPLWTYCCYTCPELANKVESGHDNSGDGLDAVDSRRLGFIIQESITTGAAQEYVDLYNKDTAALPDQPCYCVTNGADQEITTMLEKLILQLADTSHKTVQVLNAQDTVPDSECATCKGTGLQPNWNKSYHINIENIQNFAEFLIDCGGFQIC
jgi:hypothetical protein